MSNYHVPLGSSGEAAIYTYHFHELSLLRKIRLQMRSWQNYIFFESGRSRVGRRVGQLRQLQSCCYSHS
jgi:hypothetical protein